MIHPHIYSWLMNTTGLAFVIILVCQLYFYLKFFLPIAFYTKKKHSSKSITKKSLSLIMISRDLDYFDVELLKNFLSQDIQFRSLEIIIPYFIGKEGIKLQVPIENINPKISIKVIDIQQEPRHASRTKYKYYIGAKSASYEHLLFTTQFCIPHSDQWLNNMVSNITHPQTSVLSYATQTNNGGIANFFKAFQYFHRSLLSLAFASHKIPYFGSRFNMIVPKDDFLHFNQFPQFNNYHFVDHVLYYNHSPKPQIVVDIRKETIIDNSHEPHSTLMGIEEKEFRSIFPSLTLQSKVMTSVYGILHFLVWALFVILLCIYPETYLVVYVMIFRIVFYNLFMIFCVQTLRESKLLKMVFIMDIILPIYYLRVLAHYATTKKR